MSPIASTMTRDRSSRPPITDLEVAILAGGLGTRLGPVLADRPKVLAEVAGRPFLAYQLERLARDGVVDVVLCVGHLAAEVERFAEDGAFDELRVRTSRETRALGTAGAVALARRGRDGTFVVLNGDSFFDLPLHRLVARHRESGAQATIAAARVPDAGRYGSLELDRDGRVARFLEKGAAGSGLINAGIYVLEPGVVAALPLDRQTSLERDIFPALAAAGELVAMPWDGYFVDIGVPADLAEIDAHPERLLQAVSSTGKGA